MKFPFHLSDDNVRDLEYEVISDDLMIFLTRKLEAWVFATDDIDAILMRQNRLINISRTIAGKSIYPLEADSDGEYWPQERAWHNGHFKLIFRDLSTVEFAEFVCDLFKEEFLEIEEVNKLLKKDGVSFCFIEEGPTGFTIEVMAIADLEDEIGENGEHSNIRVLVHRMDSALDSEDFSGVLHSSASIFETLAKDIVGTPGIQNQTLGGFFQRYRNDSLLPDSILDYIKDTYNDRNTTPLAGHGSTDTPQITKEESIVLSEMTKAFVKMEYKLRTA
jgi:hypothetical protein